MVVKKDLARRRHHVRHPVNVGELIADKVTAFAGTFTFLGLNALWWILWIVFQVEPFPYGLLTMILSLEAIALATLIMISQNRQAQKDHMRDDRDDAEIGDILIMARELKDMQTEQMKSHAAQNKKLDELLKLGLRPQADV